MREYADTKVPMLARMHGKRLTAYRRLSPGPASRHAVSHPGRLDWTGLSIGANDDQGEAAP